MLFYCYYRIDEIFTWLLEVADDSKELSDGGKIVWSVTYIYDNPRESSLELTPDDNKKRIIAKLEVNKDDIQAVLPMAKVCSLIFILIWILSTFCILNESYTLIQYESSEIYNGG